MAKAPTSVLIADDESVVRDLLKELFEDHGFQVLGMASTLEDTVALYGRLRPDLVTLDMRMPGGGLTAIKALQEIDPQVRIMVISGASGGAFIAVAKEYGIKAFVEKPFSWEAIDAAILQLL